jgi:hypothetical protein
MKNEELYVNIREMASTLVVPNQCLSAFRKILPVGVALSVDIYYLAREGHAEGVGARGRGGVLTAFLFLARSASSTYLPACFSSTRLRSILVFSWGGLWGRSGR